MMRTTSKSLLFYILLIVGILCPRECAGLGVKSMMACENGMMFIKCPHNTVVITIADASYGRELSKKFVCQSEDPNVVIKDCGVSNVKARVQQQCEGKTECSFTANNKNLGYFCTNVYKYLLVLYDCIPRPSTKEPTTAIPTTLSSTSTIEQKPTTKRLTTRTLDKITTTITNDAMQNLTNFNETTTKQPETTPIESYGHVIPLTRKPNIDAYDREIFKRNHGLSSCVSGTLVTSLLMATLLSVFLNLRIT